MKIQLYNTCPEEFKKKLKKIRKDLLPEQKDGKIIKEKFIDEEVPQPRVCYSINYKGPAAEGKRKKAACKTCPHWNNALGRRFSDLTMMISLEEV